MKHAQFQIIDAIKRCDPAAQNLVKRLVIHFDKAFVVEVRDVTIDKDVLWIFDSDGFQHMISAESVLKTIAVELDGIACLARGFNPTLQDFIEWSKRS